MSLGLVALFDDIAAMADDVAKMTAMATRTASGIVGDDIAASAETLTGVRNARETAIVKKVAWGSLKNKAMIIPALMTLSAVAPQTIPVLLVSGGLYLSYEGAEKVLESFHKKHEGEESHKPGKITDPEAYERQRVEGAIRTDMVLSGEILVMGLDTMAGFGTGLKALAMPIFGAVMTMGVYGVVLGFLKMDDLGEHLARPGRSAGMQKLGRGVVKAAPYALRGLAMIGTAAMLAVGGHLVGHHIGPLGHALEGLQEMLPHAAQGWATGYAVEALAGLALGTGVAGVQATGLPGKVMGQTKALWQRVRARFAAKPAVPSAKPVTPQPAPRPDDGVSPSRQLGALSPEQAKPSAKGLTEAAPKGNGPTYNG